MPQPFVADGREPDGSDLEVDTHVDAQELSVSVDESLADGHLTAVPADPEVTRVFAVEYRRTGYLREEDATGTEDGTTSTDIQPSDWLTYCV